MENWDEKLNQKISKYQYQDDPSQEQVALFFQQMDQKKRKRFPWYMQAAAAVVLLIGVFFISYRLAEVEIMVRAGEQNVVTLPDQSTVALNEKASLSFNKLAWIWSRSVDLEGEGFFQVKKGSNFEVHSQNGKTEVLGTSFNINTHRGRYAVKCYTGKVRVSTQNRSEILSPGQAVAILVDTTIKKYEFDAKNPAGWQVGEYQFDNEDLGIVLLELSQAYEIDIRASDSLKRLKYSGYFPVDDLALSLKLICEPLDLTYVEKKDEVLIEARK